MGDGEGGCQPTLQFPARLRARQPVMMVVVVRQPKPMYTALKREFSRCYTTYRSRVLVDHVHGYLPSEARIAGRRYSLFETIAADAAQMCVV